MQENKNGCFFLNTVYIIDIFLPTLTASELIYRRLWSKLFTWSNVIRDSQPNYKICMRTKLPITRVIIKSVLQSEQQQQLASCGPHVLHIRKKARSIYRVCICMHPMTLSEVPVWPIFDFIFWGQMTPKVKRKCLSRFRDESPNYTFRDQIWWKSAVAKFPKGPLDYHTKKLALRGTRPSPPFCPKWADRAQNSLNVVTPWHVHVYRTWSGSAALCRTYSGKIDFSAPKVITI